MTDADRAEFDEWFASLFGPNPTPEWALVNLAEAALFEARRDGAMQAWEYLRRREAVS